MESCRHIHQHYRFLKVKLTKEGKNNIFTWNNLFDMLLRSDRNLEQILKQSTKIKFNKRQKHTFSHNSRYFVLFYNFTFFYQQKANKWKHNCFSLSPCMSAMLECQSSIRKIAHRKQRCKLTNMVSDSQFNSFNFVTWPLTLVLLLLL